MAFGSILSLSLWHPGSRMLLEALLLLRRVKNSYDNLFYDVLSGSILKIELAVIEKLNDEVYATNET